MSNLKEPQKLVRPAPKTYWLCNTKNHNHLKFEVAMRCIKKHPGQSPMRWTCRELARVLEMRGKKMTYAEIASVFKVSYVRIQQVMHTINSKRFYWQKTGKMRTAPKGFRDRGMGDLEAVFVHETFGPDD